MTNADRIELRGLSVMALCGILPEERERRQPFDLDLDVYCDLTAPGMSDDLANTIDYGALCTAVAEVAEREQFGLLERFAQRVVEVILANPQVEAVTVSVHKMRPPVPHQLASSGVRIHRER